MPTFLLLRIAAVLACTSFLIVEPANVAVYTLATSNSNNNNNNRLTYLLLREKEQSDECKYDVCAARV